MKKKLERKQSEKKYIKRCKDKNYIQVFLRKLCEEVKTFSDKKKKIDRICCQWACLVGNVKVSSSERKSMV